MPSVQTAGFESLYDKLRRASSFEEEKSILDSYFNLIGQDDPTAYNKIKQAAQYETNSHIWRIVTARDRNGNVKGRYLMTDLFMTVPGGSDPFD